MPLADSTVQTLMEKHRHRELTVKMLEAFKAGRNKRITELRSAEVEKSLQEILAKVRVILHYKPRNAMITIERTLRKALGMRDHDRNMQHTMQSHETAVDLPDW